MKPTINLCNVLLLLIFVHDYRIYILKKKSRYGGSSWLWGADTSRWDGCPSVTEIFGNIHSTFVLPTFVLDKILLIPYIYLGVHVLIDLDGVKKTETLYFLWNVGSMCCRRLHGGFECKILCFQFFLCALNVLFVSWPNWSIHKGTFAQCCLS